MESTEILIQKLGSKGKYQILISVLFFFVGLGMDFSAISLPMMISAPLGYYHVKNDLNSPKIAGIVNKDFCNQAGTFKIHLSSPSNNIWAYDIELYCDTARTTLLMTSIYIGYLIGFLLTSQISMLWKEKLVKLLVVVYPASFLLLIPGNFYCILVMILLHGICQLSCFLLKNSIIAEMTEIRYKPLFLGFQITSSIVMAVICPILFESGIHWIIIYYAVAVFTFLSSICLIIFLKPNPRNLLLLNQLQAALESAKYIANFNKVYALSEDLIKEESKVKSQVSLCSDVISSDSDLEKWIIAQFQMCEDIELNNLSQVESEDTDKGQSSTSVDTFVPFQVNENVQPSYKNDILLAFLNLFFKLCLNICVIELYNYTSFTDFKLWFIFSALFGGILMCILYVTAKSRLGPRVIILLSLLLILTTRIIITCTKFSSSFIYFCLRALCNSTQIPIHSLLSDSYIDPNKLSFYNKLGFLIQIMLIGAPALVNYLPFIGLNLLFMCFTVASIIPIIFLTLPTNIPEIDQNKLGDF